MVPSEKEGSVKKASMDLSEVPKVHSSSFCFLGSFS
jgi:hypothetical protein